MPFQSETSSKIAAVESRGEKFLPRLDFWKWSEVLSFSNNLGSAESGPSLSISEQICCSLDTGNTNDKETAMVCVGWDWLETRYDTLTSDPGPWLMTPEIMTIWGWISALIDTTCHVSQRVTCHVSVISSHIYHPGPVSSVMPGRCRARHPHNIC